jgi:hypothetical protein
VNSTHLLARANQWKRFDRAAGGSFVESRRRHVRGRRASKLLPQRVVADAAACRKGGLQHVEQLITHSGDLHLQLLGHTESAYSRRCWRARLKARAHTRARGRCVWRAHLVWLRVVCWDAHIRKPRAGCGGFTLRQNRLRLLMRPVDHLLVQLRPSYFRQLLALLRDLHLPGAPTPNDTSSTPDSCASQHHSAQTAQG